MEGEGQQRGEGSCSSLAAVSSVSLSQLSPGAQPATDAPLRRGCRPPPHRHQLLPNPAPLEPAALLAGPLGDRLQMEPSGCLFCFGGGGVSEPRTYLANEVVITPGLTNRMKTRGSAEATDGLRVPDRSAEGRVSEVGRAGAGQGEGAEAVLLGASHTGTVLGSG